MNNWEILYLIARYLDALGCEDGSETVKCFLNSQYAGLEGNQVDRLDAKTFEEFDLTYNDIEPYCLSHICNAYFDFASTNKSGCLRSLSSLLALIKSHCMDCVE